MQGRFLSISKDNFVKFLDKLTGRYNVVVPAGAETNYLIEKFKGNFVFNNYRAVSSVRQFFVSSQESLGSCFNGRPLDKKPFCVVGAKSCDLQSLKIQDYVFLDGQVDEHYKYMRDNNVIISSDCSDFKDVCFCLNLDIDPYPEELFDLNLSALDDIFLVEVASDKGKKLVDDNSSFFQEARQEHLEQRLKSREYIVNRLLEHLKNQNLPSKGLLYDLIKNSSEDNLWREEGYKCVECGACIMNCPTCHCFLIFDTTRDSEYLRGRVWDGCQYKNFARVAGGANPLKFRAERLRNRYIKKFEFFPDNLGMYACTGCGRCIDGCIAKIDLREIFKKLVKSRKTKV